MSLSKNSRAQDPVEGSREMIDRELERQDKKGAENPQPKPGVDQAKAEDQGKQRPTG